mmetsp:Transcript_4319/g.6348  ORF Transcript_4319/g.6348 Transcript_4319/m.6348 type:complete len:581 (+) Transcript_4319:34-1776(+)
MGDVTKVESELLSLPGEMEENKTGDDDNMDFDMDFDLDLEEVDDKVQHADSNEGHKPLAEEERKKKENEMISARSIKYVCHEIKDQVFMLIGKRQVGKSSIANLVKKLYPKSDTTYEPTPEPVVEHVVLKYSEKNENRKNLVKQFTEKLEKTVNNLGKIKAKKALIENEKIKLERDPETNKAKIEKSKAFIKKLETMLEDQLKKKSYFEGQANATIVDKSITIVDTEGFFKNVSKDGSSRTNHQLKTTLRTVMLQNISHLNVIGFVITMNATFEDFSTIIDYLRYFSGGGARKVLIITHAESVSKEQKEQFVKELLEHPIMGHLLRREDAKMFIGKKNYSDKELQRKFSRDLANEKKAYDEFKKNSTNTNGIVKLPTLDRNKIKTESIQGVEINRYEEEFSKLAQILGAFNKMDVLFTGSIVQHENQTARSYEALIFNVANMKRKLVDYITSATAFVRKEAEYDEYDNEVEPADQDLFESQFVSYPFMKDEVEALKEIFDKAQQSLKVLVDNQNKNPSADFLDTHKKLMKKIQNSRHLQNQQGISHRFKEFVASDEFQGILTLFDKDTEMLDDLLNPFHH